MLKFIAGVAVGFMAYNTLLNYVIRDEDTFNEFVEIVNGNMGYDVSFTGPRNHDYNDDIDSIVDGMIRSFRSENKA